MSDPQYFAPDWVVRGLQRFDRWLKSRQPDIGTDLGPVASFWGNPTWALICLILFLVTLFMPSEGFGFRLCMFYHATGMECPGCGMTRGVSSVWRGDLLRSIQLHLFAPVVFLFLGFQSSSLFLPPNRKAKVLRWIDRHDSIFRMLWVGGAAAFLIYGSFRIAYSLFRG